MSKTARGGAPVNVVLLAAGRGSRLGTLAQHTHKSLLPVAGKPALQYVIDEVLARPVRDVVIVTGDKHEAIEEFVSQRYGGRIRPAYNARFAEDTNILSTETGVAALERPEDGYLIIETDLIIEPSGWSQVLDVGDGRDSFWVTRGRYSTSLTGGALQVDARGHVTDLVYAPKYEPRFEGYQKLLGILYVGREQVAKDRELRIAGMRRTIAQYYMTPWVENLPQLPCRALSLGSIYAASYNDVETYQQTDRRFAEVLAGTVA
ncbi:MAG TPA: NTP transferase domain-containing protein [Steroidobacteraceae bacterium]|jgi:CTP:molybdopterin cytidylyltransferase MocA|nr:NTP transferase domain-containing protein [Steroidobacteraceae bacterium]